MHVGRQGLYPVQIVFIVCHAVAILLQQFHVQLLLLHRCHAKPGRQGLLSRDALGDQRGPAQIGVDDGIGKRLEGFVLFLIAKVLCA